MPEPFPEQLLANQRDTETSVSTEGVEHEGEEGGGGGGEEESTAAQSQEQPLPPSEVGEVILEKCVVIQLVLICHTILTRFHIFMSWYSKFPELHTSMLCNCISGTPYPIQEPPHEAEEPPSGNTESQPPSTSEGAELPPSRIVVGELPLPTANMANMMVRTVIVCCS